MICHSSAQEFRQPHLQDIQSALQEWALNYRRQEPKRFFHLFADLLLPGSELFQVTPHSTTRNFPMDFFLHSVNSFRGAESRCLHRGDRRGNPAQLGSIQEHLVAIIHQRLLFDLETLFLMQQKTLPTTGNKNLTNSFSFSFFPLFLIPCQACSQKGSSFLYLIFFFSSWERAWRTGKKMPQKCSQGKHLARNRNGR